MFKTSITAISLLLLTAFLLCDTESVEAQTGTAQNITYQSSVDQVQMEAVVWRPRNFDPQGPRVPRFIYLHGGGGTGQVLSSNPDLTAELDNRGWVGIAPDGRRWGLANLGCPDPNVGPGERDILDAFEWAKANFPIDLDRIYLSGFSMGGRGTYIIGLKNPDIFAAIAPLSPASDMYEIFNRRPDPPECKEGMVGGRPGDSLRVDTMYSITSGRFLIENAYNLPVFHGHGTLQLSPQSPLTVAVRNLNEPVFDPALVSTDVPLEPTIVLKGNFAGLTNVRVMRDGTQVLASQVVVTADRITFGQLFIGSPTVLTVLAGSTATILTSAQIYRKVQAMNHFYAGDLGKLYRVVLSGLNFQPNSKIVISGIENGANLSANDELTVYSPFTMRVPTAQTLTVQVKNSDGSLSNPLNIEIVNR